jgi:hypothetical protein
MSKIKRKFAHELIAETAKEMAATWYEDAAHDDDFYAFYPSQKKFIKREWGRFIDMARQTLAGMLGRTDVEEWQKEQIFDALIKHASMPGNMDRRVAEQHYMGLNIMPNSYGVH